MHRLLEKAYALRDKREKERLKQVEQAYNTAWRDGCDDLRDLDGKALTVFMADYREQQIADKRERKVLADINENSFVAEWTKQLNAMQEKDDVKNAKRNRANKDNNSGLIEQMAFNEAQKEEKYQINMQEAEREISEINQAIETEKNRVRHSKINEIQKGREVLEFNAKYDAINREKQDVDEEQDRILLENSLRIEREKIAEEQAKKKAGTEAARQYRKYLDEMMIKEAEDTGAVDEINRQEAEKVWKVRDDALQARQDARDYLMNLVDAGRKEQIAYRSALDAKEKEEGKVFATKFMGDIKTGIEKDRAAAEARRAKNVANNEKLKAQIAEGERAEKIQKQEVFLETLHTKHVEDKHKARLAAQGGRVRLNYQKKAIDFWAVINNK